MSATIWNILFTLLGTAGTPLGASPQGTPPNDREALFRRLEEKALNPKELARQAEAAHGCRPDERKVSDPKFREQDYGVASRANFGAMASETNPIPSNLRQPQFFPVANRTTIDTFTVMTEQSKVLPMTEFRGKAVVLFLFRPECRWTAEMIKEIVLLQGQEERAGIKVLAISLGDGGWPAVLDFKSRNRDVIPPGFQIVRPHLDEEKGVKVLPNFLVVPTTYILDPQGRVAWQILGGVRGALQDKVNHIRLEPGS